MTRSRVSSESHELPPSVRKNGNSNVATIEPSVSTETSKENGSEQTTIHAYEKNQKAASDHHLRPHQGAVAMIERQQSKSQMPAQVLPTPTSIERRFTESFFWMSHLHKKIGLSHIILLLVLAAYSALGTVVFYYLETPNERIALRKAITLKLDIDCNIYYNLDIVVAERKIELDKRIEMLAEHLSDVAENKTAEEMAEDVKNAYIDMLNVEGTYKWSTFYRSADPENNYKWTYASSFFFAMNVYTTTGYGSIAPETRAGQWFVIIYGFIFVPVTLVVIRDLGQWLLLGLTRVYARTLLKYRRWRGKKSSNDKEVIRLPIFISVLIMIGFIGCCTVFIYYLDAHYGPPGSGLDWFHSMYFSYMSFTTIGLGDVMPNNATFAPIVSIIFFLGLPVMKVVNRMTYLTVENGAFGALTVIENRIDNYWAGKQQPSNTGVEAGAGPTEEAAKDDDKNEGKSSFLEIYNPKNLAVQCTQLSQKSLPLQIPAEWVNNITIHSIATFMKANQDVYGGSFGKVNLRAADVLPSSEQDTVRSRRSHR
ncbi:unnamed protein product [Nippostrongylus brasiliensis]|uniref:Ion channel n=1 Tax=Nippostrongylus brasiliensis TaxID=27835 RepID=A0A0N4YS85_NIPBR|nr:unnamed protein product [Nippostrongylus brasiliensis]